MSSLDPMWGDLLNPLEFPMDPAKRIYWGCLLSSLVIAMVVTSIHAGRFDLRQQLVSFFDRSYWFNRSSLTDIGLMFVNNAIKVLVLAPALGSRLVATLVVGRFLQSQLGDSPSLDWPWFIIATVFSTTFFIAEDASRYFLHFAMHRNRFLWRFHQVHHTAETLTPLTLFRVHPLEHIAYFARGVIVFGLVTGTFVWLFGSALTGLDLLGVGLFGFLFNVAGANLRHSHIWVSFGRFERWFISPAQHQLHHSKHHGHVNLGSALAIWDRFMGTGQRSGSHENLEFGLSVFDAPEPSLQIKQVAT